MIFSGPYERESCTNIPNFSILSLSFDSNNNPNHHLQFTAVTSKAFNLTKIPAFNPSKCNSEYFVSPLSSPPAWRPPPSSPANQQLGPSETSLETAPTPTSAPTTLVLTSTMVLHLLNALSLTLQALLLHTHSTTFLATRYDGLPTPRPIGKVANGHIDC